MLFIQNFSLFSVTSPPQSCSGDVTRVQITLEQNHLRFVSFRLCFWRLSRNRLTINATTHTFPERYRKDLYKNVWVVALIVTRFRDKRQKHQHRRINSYRGDYIRFLNCMILFQYTGMLAYHRALLYSFIIHGSTEINFQSKENLVNLDYVYAKIEYI